MINCYIYFNEPIMVGKVSDLVSKIDSKIKIIKLLDANQINNHKSDHQKIMITNYESYQHLEIANIDEENFDEILIIDEDIRSEKDGNITYINKMLFITDIQLAISHYIKENFSENSFVPIGLNSFSKDSIYPVDLFIEENKEKLKILSAGEKLTNQIIHTLKLKTINYIFVEEQRYNEVMACILEKNAENNSNIQTQINAVEALHSYMKDLGFNPKVLDMTKKMHESIKERYTHKFMTKLLERFEKMEGTFLYNHSYLTSVIALSIGEHFSWMNFDNKEKIYLGSMLHDLGYKFEENALRETLGLNEIKTLSEEEQEDILGHTVRFSKHLEKIDNIHQDVISIVQNHHGIFEEDSYPKKIYPTEVNLIFALFILSHELTLKLYSINFNSEKIEGAIEEICEKFNKGNYKKILPEFKDTMKKTLIDEAA